MSGPIATQGMIRCTKCGAIFSGKGDDIAPLGQRTIYPWDRVACKICDQWGHTVGDLEWFPDVELPEDMEELKWSNGKILEHLSLLEEAGKLKALSLWGSIERVDDAFRGRIEEKYGSDAKYAYFKERKGFGYDIVAGGYRLMMHMADAGREYKEVKAKARWARELEKDHPVRIKAEEELAKWHEKFSDMSRWSEKRDKDVQVITADELVYAIQDAEMAENWKTMQSRLQACIEHNSRIDTLAQVKERLDAGEEVPNWMVMY